MTKNRAARLWLPLVTAALAAVLLLAACGGSNDNGNGGSYGGGYGGGSTTTTPPATTDGSTAVSIADMAFSPATLTVQAGTTVTWTNQDGVGHTVTSTDGPAIDAATTSQFDSGTLTQGESFSYTFDEPGTYYYVCTIHATMASMHAEVIVE